MQAIINTTYICEGRRRAGKPRDAAYPL